MPASVAASAVLTASGAYVHSGVGSASNSAEATGARVAAGGSATLAASGAYLFSQVGSPSNSLAPSPTVALVGSAIFGPAVVPAEPVVFELGVTSVTVSLVDADIAPEGAPVFTQTPISIQPVPIQAFGTDFFEFGNTSISVSITSLDAAPGSGVVGGLFELGARDIGLVGVPLDYVQNFAPFEFGVAPITVTRIDADFYALPPAALVPPPTTSPLAPTTREFEPPRYAVTFERSMNGQSEAVLWGSRPGGAKMALGYSAMEDAWAEAWMKFYDASRGVSPLDLPTEVYSGLSAGLTNIYNLTKYGLSWFFAGPPKIESVKEGFSAVDVDLEGRNANLLSYSAAGFVAPDAPPPAPVTDPGDPYVPLPDGDVTDVDEDGNVYFIVDDYVDEVYNNPTFGVGANNQPGPSLAVGADFATSSAYAAEGEEASGNFCLGLWDSDGFEVWSQMFGLAGTGGQVRQPSMLAQASDGGIVAGVIETAPDRHTLVGITANGTGPTVLASYSGLTASLNDSVKAFARNYPSGYILCGQASDQSRLVVTKIREDFSIENTVTLAFGTGVFLSEYSCVTDPGNSGRIFIVTLQYGIVCLDSSLNIVWDRTLSNVVIDSATVNPDGNLVVTGDRIGLHAGAPVTILSGADGTLLLSRQVVSEGSSLQTAGRFVSVRPEGGYIISSTDSSVTDNYGYTDHVAVNDDFDEVEYAIRFSSFPPDQSVFHNMGVGNRIVFANAYMLITHRALYGILPTRTSSSASYLIVRNDDVPTTAPGTFGPDPKLLVAITATISSGVTVSDDISVTREAGGPTVAASSRILPASLPVRRTIYPRVPL